MTYTACFKGFGLNCIFHRKAYPFVFLKSLFKFCAEIFSLKTRENREVSSEKCLTLQFRSSYKPIYISWSLNKHYSGYSTLTNPIRPRGEDIFWPNFGTFKTFSDQILAKLINHGVAAALFLSRYLNNFGNERIFFHLKIAEIDMGVNFGSRRTILDIKIHLFKAKPFSGGKLLTEVFQNSRLVYISCKYFKFEKKFHFPSFPGVMF